MSHALREQLASADPAARRSACVAASEDPAAAALADALCEALGDPVKGVVRAASDALVAIAAGHADVRAPLLDALHSDDPARRFGAAFTTARIDAPSPQLLPALVEALANGDSDVRWAAARIIVEAGRRHAEVLPVLVGLVRGDEQAVVRRMATFALRELAPDRPEAAQVLLEATDDGDLHVRRAAVTAMASLSEPPGAVVDRLLGALTADGDAATRRLAAVALGEIGPAVPERLGELPAQLASARSAGDDPDLDRAIERALTRLAAGRPGPD